MGEVFALAIFVQMPDHGVCNLFSRRNSPNIFGSCLGAPPGNNWRNFAVLGASTVAIPGPPSPAGPRPSPSSLRRQARQRDHGIYRVLTGPGATIHFNDTVAIRAQDDLATAFNLRDQQAGHGKSLTGGTLGGLTLVPGVYGFASSAQLTRHSPSTAPPTNPNAVFIFNIASTIIPAVRQLGRP